MQCLRPPEANAPSFGQLDHRVDVYQAGLLFLSFLLKQELVFDEAEINDGVPRERAEMIGTPVGDAIARMLRRHVEARTPTALDAWRDISHHLDPN